MNLKLTRRHRPLWIIPSIIWISCWIFLSPWCWCKCIEGQEDCEGVGGHFLIFAKLRNVYSLLCVVQLTGRWCRAERRLILIISAGGQERVSVIYQCKIIMSIGPVQRSKKIFFIQQNARHKLCVQIYQNKNTAFNYVLQHPPPLHFSIETYQRPCNKPFRR